MNWITNYVRPKINSLLQRKDMPENLWIKCPETGEMVFHKDLEANMGVIPTSGYHMKIPARQRLGYFFDDGKFEILPVPKVAQDPLRFRDQRRYSERLKDNRAKTGMEDSVFNATGNLQGMQIVACIHDFAFMGGSLGIAAGETIIMAFQKALDLKCPFVLFAASGGARMQEGILSLMQLPRTVVMVERLKEAGLPYIVVLTNPTTGGVSASYAMLGDIQIAEPGAEIGFAGKRVIEQTIRERLPDGFQTAEYLRDHGMVDLVVPRQEMRDTIANLLHLLMKKAPPMAEEEPAELPAITDGSDVMELPLEDSAADGVESESSSGEAGGDSTRGETART